jgi:hypothetical protein
METVNAPAPSVSLDRNAARPTPHALFEWSITLCAVGLVAGVYVDGWAHLRDLPETFFTPWHGIIYGAFSIAAVILGREWLAGRRRGYARPSALPYGYGLSLIGVLVFLAAGAFDLVWHALFGAENDIEALYSPPHALLAAGGGLIVTGPLRAAWGRNTSTLASSWRAILSLTMLLALLTFFTSELHPFVHPWAWVRFRPNLVDPAALGLPPLAAGGMSSRELAETLGIGGIVVQATLLMALVLLLIRRWGSNLPAGWLTCMLALDTVGLSLFHWTPWTIPVAIAGGVIGDLLFGWLKPSVQAPQRLRMFSALFPMVLFGFYFAALLLVGGIWWSVHVWLGAVTFSGVAGWLVSYLVLPPALPIVPQGAETKA